MCDSWCLARAGRCQAPDGTCQAPFLGQSLPCDRVPRPCSHRRCRPCRQSPRRLPRPRGVDRRARRAPQRPARAPIRRRPIDQPRHQRPWHQGPPPRRPRRRRHEGRDPHGRPHGPPGRGRRGLPALLRRSDARDQLRLAQRAQPRAARRGRRRGECHRPLRRALRLGRLCEGRGHLRQRRHGRLAHRDRRPRRRRRRRVLRRPRRPAENRALQLLAGLPRPRLQGTPHPAHRERPARAVRHGAERAPHLAARREHDDRAAEPRRLVHLHALLAPRRSGLELCRREVGRRRARALPRGLPRRRAAHADAGRRFRAESRGLDGDCALQSMDARARRASRRCSSRNRAVLRPRRERKLRGLRGAR